MLVGCCAVVIPVMLHRRVYACFPVRLLPWGFGGVSILFTSAVVWSDTPVGVLLVIAASAWYDGMAMGVVCGELSLTSMFAHDAVASGLMTSASMCQQCQHVALQPGAVSICWAGCTPAAST